MKKRIISMLLVFCMIVSLTPFSAFAEASDTRFHAHYDINRGSVFVTLDGSEPDDGDYMPDMNFDTYYSGSTVTKLLVDPLRVIDRDVYRDDEAIWNAYANEEEIQFCDNGTQDGVSINIHAHIAKQGEQPQDFMLVENGAAVYPGATFADNLLTFPLNTEDVTDYELDVSFTRAEYDYKFFPGTEEKPVMIEASWWGIDELARPAGIDEGDFIREGNRFKIRVPSDRESLTFGWGEDDIVRRVRVEGAGENGDWLEINRPDGNSYTLQLDLKWDNEQPRDFYCVEFDFEEPREDDWSLRMHYDMNGGIAYVKTGAYDGAQYDNRESEFDLSPITVTLDNTKRVDWNTWDWDDNDCVPDLIEGEPWEDLSVSIIADFDTFDGHFHEPVVIDGAAVADGFTYEDGVLTFTPAGRRCIDLNIMWTRNEYDYIMFGGTEEKPVLVEAYYQEGVEIILPDDVNEEDIYRESSRFKARVAADRESFEIKWDDAAKLRGVKVNRGRGYQDAECPEGSSYTVTLDAEDDFGNPNYHYQVDFDFDAPRDDDHTLRLHYDMNGGIVFMGDTPVFDGEDAEVGDGPITLRFDNTLRMNWDSWDSGEPQLEENEPWDNVSVNIRAHCDMGDGWFEGELVRGGSPASEGVTFENGVFTFDFGTKHLIEVDIFWTDEDYEFCSFPATEEKPILVELHSWGNGEFILPEFVDDEDKLIMGDRAIFRVSAAHPAVHLTWVGSKVERFRVEMEHDWYEVEDPDFVYYNLFLNQKWDNGEPKDHYTVEINFRGEKVRPGVHINNYDIDYTVTGLEGGDDGEYTFAPGADEATVTVDTSNERFRAVWLRMLRIAADPVVTVFVPADGKFTLINDGSYYDLEFIDWNMPLDSQFQVFAHGDLTVRVAGETVENEQNLPFTTGTPIAFSCDEKPYKVVVVPAYADEDFIEFSPSGKDFTYTPANGNGFTINIFQNEKTYEFFAFQTYNDWERFAIIPIELEYQAGTAEDGWLEIDQDVEGSVQGLDVMMVKVERGTKVLAVRPVTEYGYVFRLFLGDEEVTDKIGGARGVYNYDISSLDRDRLLRAVLVKDESTPDMYAVNKDTGEEYRAGDTVKIEKGETVLIRFEITSASGLGRMVCGWRNDILNQSGFTVPDDPVIEDDWTVYASVTAGADIGTVAEMPYSWYKTSDIFGEGAPGWADAVPLLTSSLKFEIVDHDWGEWTVVKAATCETAGERTRTCAKCGKTETEEIPALGHDWGEWVYNNDATVDKDGTKTRVCKNDPTHTETVTAEGTRLAPKVEFKDVVPGAFYEEAVSWAVANGVTAGTSATTFSPNNKCTRGQVVTFLYRAAGSPAIKNKTNPFTDVKEGAFYYDAVLWAVENDVTAGLTKTTFGPGKECTRGQVVTFLWRAKGKPAATQTSHPFTDVSATGFYYNAMLWAVENGVTNGTTATTFGPNKTCTRGQVVTFLYRAFNGK